MALFLEFLPDLEVYSCSLTDITNFEMSLREDLISEIDKEWEKGVYHLKIDKKNVIKILENSKLNPILVGLEINTGINLS